MRILKLTAALGIGTSLLCGCTTQPAPVFASSAHETTYAERYPATLLALRSEETADESHARDLFSGFQNYPAALSAPNGEQVLAVVKRADDAGKGGEFAAQMDENQHVSTFFSEEKESLHQKIGGAAAYAAKQQKECTADVASPAIGAFDRGVDKALEDRLRGHSEAHRYIEDHQDALGKPNLEKLGKQADEITLASYLVHVRVKELKTELSRLVDEASDVKKTLAQSDADAKAVIADAGSSKSAKATAQTRSTAAEAATVDVDTEVGQAKQVLTDMDKRLEKLDKDYAAALDALEKAISALPKKP